MDYSSFEEAASLLYTPILNILEANPEGITEYELMTKLSGAHHPFPWEEARTGDLQLFRSHFFLFYVLYRLRDLLLEEKRGELSIFCLKIKLHPYSSPQEEEGTAAEADGTGDHVNSRQSDKAAPAGDSNIPAEADPMREYYLDLSNMEKVGEAEVRDMIDGFFRMLESYYRMEEDLAVLGLQADATVEMVRKKYRTLALKHHPDRGGSAEDFRRIEEAMTRINRLYGLLNFPP
ncbi:MAG: DNA-J related domain-containing protein [Spirochaetia bacterium]